MIRYRRTWLFLLLPLALGLVTLAQSNPAATERIYARGIYPVLMSVLGRVFSVAHFSVAEWLILLLPLLLLIYIVRQVLLCVRRKRERRQRIAKLSANLFCIVGFGYFLFTAFCGFNYHRESFTVTSGLELRPSSTAELAAMCTELLDRANELRSGLAEDENGVMVSSFEDYYDTAGFARDAYTNISIQYPELGGYTVRPKPVVFSRAMSYLDITGVYVPFTFEANVNVDVLPLWVPSTMMHELAHSKGYMREDEANFISYLACTASGNRDFGYSGTVLALVHSTNALYSADRELYYEVRTQYSEELERDIAANSTYWKQFEGPVAQVSSAVNDVYLRSNRQSDGVRSYGRMVDLLLADYRQRHGLD